MDERPWCLYLDNDKQHHASAVTTLLANLSLGYRFLSPYSPFLSAIEYNFGAIADYLNTDGMEAPMAELSGNRTAQQLKDLSRRVLTAVQNTVSAARVRQYERRCQAFIPACLAGVPICDGSHPPDEDDIAAFTARMAPLRAAAARLGVPVKDLMPGYFPPTDAAEAATVSKVKEGVRVWREKRGVLVGTERAPDLRKGTPHWCARATMEHLAKYCSNHPKSKRAKFIYEYRRARMASLRAARGERKADDVEVIDEHMLKVARDMFDPNAPPGEEPAADGQTTAGAAGAAGAGTDLGSGSGAGAGSGSGSVAVAVTAAGAAGAAGPAGAGTDIGSGSGAGAGSGSSSVGVSISVVPAARRHVPVITIPEREVDVDEIMDAIDTPMARRAIGRGRGRRDLPHYGAWILTSGVDTMALVRRSPDDEPARTPPTPAAAGAGAGAAVPTGDQDSDEGEDVGAGAGPGAGGGSGRRVRRRRS